MPTRSVTMPTLKELTSRTLVNAKMQFPVEGLSKECFGNIFILFYFILATSLEAAVRA